ncbi:Protein of unknown function [Gryllus bimaculatus]|nr:Protein of unknown function [Gryllus bimaculatus]
MDIPAGEGLETDMTVSPETENSEEAQQEVASQGRSTPPRRLSRSKKAPGWSGATPRHAKRRRVREAPLHPVGEASLPEA